VRPVSEPLLLGIDVGTTAIKSALFTTAGHMIASGTQEYDLMTPAANVVEVHTETYWAALRQTVQAVISCTDVRSRDIVALSLSAQGETLVPTDASGNALRPAIVWLDNRAGAEAVELANRFGHDEIYRVTGQPEMVAAWPAAKVLWLARHEPDIHSRAARYLLIEDYLLHRICGEFVSEGSLLTSSCYWNFRTKEWWPEMLDAVELDRAQLPTIAESGVLIGTIRPEVAAELGLPPTIRVCTGGLDQACGAIGVGNVRPGRVSENTGAAVALCATVSTPSLDPDRTMPCHYHAIPDTWMYHTFTAGGIVLRWFRDQFCAAERHVAESIGQDAYDLIARQAELTPPGAEGLVMLPHLQGAMAPESNQNARGTLVGLSLAHGKGHVARAILESIAFVVRRNIDVVERLDSKVDLLYALGGGSKSPQWKQIEADVIQRPVVTTGQPDAAALGAAILAGVGVGLYDNPAEAADQMVSIDRTFTPNPALAGLYDDMYGAYISTYDALCPVFDQLAALGAGREVT
jgi:sugar (pentulose or hexulose) kinase